MTDSWESYQKLVLDKLVTLAKDVARIEDKLEVLTVDVAMLKVKAGMWGALAGLVPAAVALVLTAVTS